MRPWPAGSGGIGPGTTSEADRPSDGVTGTSRRAIASATQEWSVGAKVGRVIGHERDHRLPRRAYDCPGDRAATPSVAVECCLASAASQATDEIGLRLWEPRQRDRQSGRSTRCLSRRVSWLARRRAPRPRARGRRRPPEMRASRAEGLRRAAAPRSGLLLKLSAIVYRPAPTRASSSWPASPPRDELGMHDDKEAVGLLEPLPPGCSDRLEFVTAAEPILHRLLGQGRRDHAVGPQLAPPPA